MTAELASHLPQAAHALEQPYLARRQNWVNQLERHAMMQPRATAIRYLGHTVTWADLRYRVAALAGSLSRRGVGFGDRVMILMLNRTEFVESVLAANMLGAIAVPLNFRLTPSEIAFLVEDCAPRLVITEEVLAQVAVGVREIAPALSTIVVAGGASDPTVVGYDELISETGDPPEPVDIPNDSPALIMYTSGTTGRPKGAVLTHTNLTGQVMTALYTGGANINSDVGFIGVPFFHIAGIGNMLSGMLLGVPTVIYPLGAFNPGQLLDVLEAERVSGIFLVPAQWQAVCAEQQARPRELSLRVMSWGAAPAPAPAASDVRGFPGNADHGGVRSDRDVSGHLHAARRRCDPKARFGRQSDPDRLRSRRRRRDERRAHRSGRRNRLPGTNTDERILEQPGSDRRSVRRRLVSFRGSGPDGRGRLRLGGGPQEGHDHLRRRERLLRRSGERACQPPRHCRGRGDRPSRRKVGRGTDSGRGCNERPPSHRRLR
nr:Long-chain-fatty-acid--CoA ligase, Mycobacterial subgroup FadD5 [Mycobacterium pseudoshottsii]